MVWSWHNPPPPPPPQKIHLFTKRENKSCGKLKRLNEQNKIQNPKNKDDQQIHHNRKHDMTRELTREQASAARRESSATTNPTRSERKQQTSYKEIDETKWRIWTRDRWIEGANWVTQATGLTRTRGNENLTSKQNMKRNSLSRWLSRSQLVVI